LASEIDDLCSKLRRRARRVHTRADVEALVDDLLDALHATRLDTTRPAAVDTTCAMPAIDH
ncbi:hypothetical protein ACFQRD_16685, partial [Brachybacterium sp. GCM10030268]|uniref:hypothetical protein n=1 Tax=Brachybacterium sp. GCM10030268 TaxID=3273382 RepID=UPI00361E4FCA